MKRKNSQTFPYARIKKIIQKNEEIGKVSSTIPFLISKSLEMFLTDLISNTANLAKE